MKSKKCFYFLQAGLLQSQIKVLQLSKPIWNIYTPINWMSILSWQLVRNIFSWLDYPREISTHLENFLNFYRITAVGGQIRRWNLQASLWGNYQTRCYCGYSGWPNFSYKKNGYMQGTVLGSFILSVGLSKFLNMVGKEILG